MRTTWMGFGAGNRFGTFTLRRDETLRPGPGVVRVERGTALLTQAGDPDDHVLEAGDAFRPSGSGLVVLWALADAVVTVAPATAPRADEAPAPCAA